MLSDLSDLPMRVKSKTKRWLLYITYIFILTDFACDLENSIFHFNQLTFRADWTSCWSGGGGHSCNCKKVKCPLSVDGDTFNQLDSFPPFATRLYSFSELRSAI